MAHVALWEEKHGISAAYLKVSQSTCDERRHSDVGTSACTEIIANVLRDWFSPGDCKFKEHLVSSYHTEGFWNPRLLEGVRQCDKSGEVAGPLVNKHLASALRGLPLEVLEHKAHSAKDMAETLVHLRPPFAVVPVGVKEGQLGNAAKEVTGDALTSLVGSDGLSYTFDPHDHYDEDDQDTPSLGMLVARMSTDVVVLSEWMFKVVLRRLRCERKYLQFFTVAASSVEPASALSKAAPLTTENGGVPCLAMMEPERQKHPMLVEDSPAVAHPVAAFSVEPAPAVSLAAPLAAEIDGAPCCAMMEPQRQGHPILDEDSPAGAHPGHEPEQAGTACQDCA